MFFFPLAIPSWTSLSLIDIAKNGQFRCKGVEKGRRNALFLPQETTLRKDEWTYVNKRVKEPFNYATEQKSRATPWEWKWKRIFNCEVSFVNCFFWSSFLFVECLRGTESAGTDRSTPTVGQIFSVPLMTQKACPSLIKVCSGARLLSCLRF